MCGIVGIAGAEPVNQRLYDALLVLQHRGQDAAGIFTYDRDRLCSRKAIGLVRDVFRAEHMLRLGGNTGIAHVRYPTAGRFTAAEAQPFYTNSPYGVSLAHNGNLTNTTELKRQLFEEDLRQCTTDSDSEVLLNVLANELHRERRFRLTSSEIFDAVSRVVHRVRGAYAVVAMIGSHGLLAFRDPHGIRPLAMGRRTSNGRTEVMFASESVALDALGFGDVEDVLPGEAVFVDFDGNVVRRLCASNPVHTPCLFEFVYLARPDSKIDGISVHKTRARMGIRLAHKILRERPDHGIDVVIPIPDTSRTAALELAQVLGVKYSEGFIKNRYIGRTFIMPGQAERQKSVRQKLNPIDLEFRGKTVLLVDDSIVRGTTCRQIIALAREAGARQVFFASAAPPVTHPNVYGIDMPAAEELVAHGRTVAEVEKHIGADWLVYQDLPDLIEAAREGNRDIASFEASVFNGQYVTGDISPAYLARLSAARSDGARQQALHDAAEAAVVGERG